ncbi:MAG: filamentous hemagglutinin [Candidatus Paceibacteria bacterium]|jgi:filamentous hemagglutinin
MPSSTLRALSPAGSLSRTSVVTQPMRTWKRVVTHAVLMIHVMQAVLWTLPVQAQTVAAPAAPSGQKAIMDAAANGTPIAHIAPPGASGVSRNQYDQFNVTGKGLILNNSATNVQTVQGGWITGNPQLGLIPARIILNEVVSTNPSTLRGTIEVAGRRADIVVANPNGIACDGCGFLNANRATLTTGQLQFGSGGAVNGFDVRQGALGIGAAGLNASNLEQLDLIARGLVIDGEVWAKNLNVIAGANQVLYGTLSAAAQSGSGVAPRFAIDIKDLGGMYANQIVLVATDKGLGVNSTGRLAALQGNLTLSANGDLTLKDSYAAQTIRIDGQANTTLTGTTQSGAAITIGSAGAIAQQGTLDAQGALALSATDIRNSGAVIQRDGAGATLTASGRLDNSGTVYAGAELRLQGELLSDTNGTLQALGDIAVTARNATLSGTQLAAQGAIRLAAGTLNTSSTRIQSASSLSIQGDTVTNHGGLWQAGQSLVLQTGTFDNSRGVLSSNGSVQINAGTFGNNNGLVLAQGRDAAISLQTGTMTNRSGIIESSAGTTIAAALLDNTEGSIRSGLDPLSGTGSLNITSAALTNERGQLVGRDTLQVTTGTLNNASGIIASRSARAVITAGTLDNQRGLVTGLSTVLSTQAIDNTGGELSGMTALEIDTSTQGLVNDSGKLLSGGDLNLRTGMVSGKGTIAATRDIAITASTSTLNNDGALISAGRDASMVTGSLSNHNGAILTGGNLAITARGLDNRDGTLRAQQTARIGLGAGTLDNSAGAIIATDGLHIVAGALTSNGGQLVAQGRDSTVTLQADSLANRSGVIDAAGSATITATGGIDNTFGMIRSGTQAASTDGRMIVTSASLANAGALTLARDALQIITGALDNTTGVIASRMAGVGISAAALTNTAGLITGNAASLSTQTISNAGGEISSSGTLSINASGQVINNGKLLAGGDLGLSAERLSNTGSIAASRDVAITASALDNDGARISAGRDTVLASSGRLSNRAGAIVAANALTLSAGTFDTSAGALLAGRNVNVDAGSIEATGATISAADTVTLAATGALVNRRGTIITDGSLAIAAATLNNRDGVVSAKQTARIALGSGQLDNRAGQLIGAGGLMLESGAVSNAGGVLASGAGLALDTQGQQLDNTSGTVIATGGLHIVAGTLASNGGQLVAQGRDSSLTLQADSLANRSGVIDAAGSATITATGAIDNTLGTIRSGTQAASTDGRLTVTSASLTNAGALTLARDALQIGTGALDNATGIIASRTAGVGLSAAALTNTGGLITGNTASLSTQTISNAGGEISSSGALSINANGQVVNNGSGKLLAGGDLGLSSGGLSSTGSIAAGRDIAITATSLDNDGARISAGRDAVIASSSGLSNRAGTIVAGNALILSAGALDTSAGALLAGRNLTAYTGSIDATDATISAADTITLAATDALVNRRGMISTDGNLAIAASSLDNRSGIVSARQNTGINLGTGLLDNAAGQLIGSAALTLRSGAIRNAGGTLASGASLVLNTQGQLLDNSGNGQIIAQRDITLTSVGLGNAGGTIAALQGALIVNTGTAALDNTGGKLQASGNIDLTGGALGNRAGLIAGHDITLTGTTLDNRAAGRIIAAHQLRVTTQAISNDTGLLQAAGAVTLDTQGGLLTNTASGSGGILAGTALAITSGDLDTQSGFIASNGAQTISVVRDIDNRGGQLVSGADSTITLRNLNNGTGRVSAAGNLTITGSGGIDNRAGQIAANGSATITAASLGNTASGVIEANDITLNAATVDNAGGAIRAQRNLSLTSTALDNTSATISARNNLSISANSLANSGGHIVSNGTAALTTDSHSIDGTLSAQDLTLTRQNGGDFTNSAVLSVQRNLTINAGNVTNSGTLAAGATLTANASGNLLNSGEISASTTRLNVGGTLTNTASGLIDGVSTTIHAGTTNNSGRIYGDVLGINGNTINNRGSGTIAARQTLLLGAQAIGNTDGGLLYSLGDLAIGGYINSAGQLQAAASTLVNASSRIEAAGVLSVDAASIVNRNDQLTTRTISGAPVLQDLVQPVDSATRYPVAQCSGIGGDQDKNTCIVHPDLFGLRSTVTTARTVTPAVVSGDSPTPESIQVNYSRDAPVFARFAVTPVGAPPAEPSGGCSTTFDGGSVPLYTPGCNTWRAQYASWDTGFQSALDQLENAITPYNASVNEDNRQVEFEDYTRYRINATTSTTEVVTSAPAKLLSGAGMRLAGTTINHDSQIVAGGALTIVGPAVQNPTTQGETRTSSSGTSEFSQVDACGFLGGSHCRNTSAQTPFNPAPTVDPFNLPTTQLVQFAANPTTVRDLTTTTTAPAGTTAGTIGSVASAPASLNASGPISAVLQPALGVVNAGGGVPAISALPTQRVLVLNPVAASGPVVMVSPQSISAPPASGTLVLNPVATGGAVSPQQVDDKQGNAFIVTAPPSLRAPSASLFTIHAAPESRTLVETDPRFTNHRAFIGSDYFLQALQRDPERQLKRYGDGFAEQQLVNDQILTLTGRRFLSGYSSTETEYQALMDSGVAFARKYQLTPGVALSAEQMALLTTDIVWLSTQNVTLADGTVQQVLAPQVFLRRPKDGDLTPTGALIAGSDVTIRTDRDLVNSGTIAASGNLTLVAGGNLVNQGGRLSGQDIVARASNDLKNLSGVIQGSGGDSRVTLLAGRDVVIETRTIDTANGSGNSTRSAIDRVATVQGGTVRIDAARDLLVSGASVGASSDLIATTGGDLRISSVDQHYQIAVGDSSGRTVQGRSGYITDDSLTQATAKLAAGGNLALVAGGNLGVRGATVSAGDSVLLQGANVTIAAAKERTTTDIQTIGKNAYNRVARSDEALVGGSVSATNDLSVIANGRDGAGNIAINAGYLSSKAGQVGLVAGNDITVGGITTAHDAINDSYSKSGNLVSSTTTTASQRGSSDQVQGSILSGNTILAQAGDPTNATNRTGDITIAGSSLVADRDLRLDAGRNLTITTAQGTQQDSSAFRQTTSGLFTSGAALTLGERQQKQTAAGTATSSIGSTVASLNGNATLVAGQRYTQTGSDLLTPNGSIDITARKIDITAATDTAEQRQQQQFKQSGLTVTVSNPVISAAQTAQQMTAAAGKTKDVRMQALAAATTVLAAAKAVDAVTDPDKATSIGVSISLGGSKSQSDSTQRSSTVRGSTVAAGGDVTLRSIGDKAGNSADGTDGNITVSGSRISAGRDARLLADGKIDLTAASNTAAQTSSNNSSSASVGIGFSVGANTGLSVSANATVARGKADGTDVTQVNSQIAAGDQVTLKSGGDTILDGAVVRGRQVTGDIGGNLVIASRQDTSVYAGKQQSASAGITVPIGAGQVSGNLNVSKLNSTGTFASVAEQSGLMAGDQGFNVNVANNTDLKGGVISSTDQAMRDGKNSLTTGTLTQSDIQNYSSASVKSSGINLSSDMLTQGKYGLGKAVISNGLSNSKESDASSGVTRSAVQGASVTITDGAAQQALTGKTAAQTVASLNTDTANAQTAAKKLGLQAMERTVQAEQAIKETVIAETFKLSDEAYRKLFLKSSIVIALVTDPETRKLTSRQLSDEEKQNLQPAEDGKVHVSTNGIFNDQEAAIKYVRQHSLLTGPQYLVYFPEANNVVSELMVAAYQSFLENKTLGLSTTTEEVKRISDQYGQTGLQLDGHSRGTLTIGNVLEAKAKEEQAQGSISKTTVSFFGPAYNAKKADGLLSILQDRAAMDNMQAQMESVLTLQNHVADPVGIILGGNPATGGTIPENSTALTEMIRAATGKPDTSHNCYGSTNNRPECGPFWSSTPSQLIPVNKLQDPKEGKK